MAKLNLVRFMHIWTEDDKYTRGFVVLQQFETSTYIHLASNFILSLIFHCLANNDSWGRFRSHRGKANRWFVYPSEKCKSAICFSHMSLESSSEAQKSWSTSWIWDIYLQQRRLLHRRVQWWMQTRIWLIRLYVHHPQ